VQALWKTGLECKLKAAFIFGSSARGDNSGMFRFHRLPRRCVRLPARAAGAVLLALAGALAPTAHAGGKDDHERARAALQAGEVLPLPVVLERLQRDYPGRVLEVDLEREDGRWIYEIRLVQADGRLLKLEVDAATARILELRRR
jgi:hypothetical protein